MIGSSFHKLVEAWHNHKRSFQDPATDIFLEAYKKCPVYCFHDDLKDMFEGQTQGATLASTHAMFKVGKAKLPFPTISVELWPGSHDAGRMYIMYRQKDEIHFEIYMVAYNMETTELTEVIHADVKYTPEAWSITYDALRDRLSEVKHAIGGLNLALLMTHVKEIEEDDVEVSRMNKARLRSGKTRVLNHTIVRIGHYYDKSGQRHSFRRGGSQITKVYMRAGHNRMQQHGPKWMAENPEEAALPFNTNDHHLIWIEPVLVNYEDGSELPLPKTKVVRK